MIVCLTGPESSGKSTLAAALAEQLRAPLVPEVARRYLAARTTRLEGGQASSEYGPDDVLAIAAMQVAEERAAEERAAEERAAEERAPEERTVNEWAAEDRGQPVVVSDTDLSVIRVWWETRFGVLHPWIEEQWQQRSPRVYLLMRPDLPWDPDPLREARAGRDALFLRYQALLRGDRFPWAEIGGEGPSRLAAVWRALHRMGVTAL